MLQLERIYERRNEMKYKAKISIYLKVKISEREFNNHRLVFFFFYEKKFKIVFNFFLKLKREEKNNMVALMILFIVFFFGNFDFLKMKKKTNIEKIIVACQDCYFDI